MQRPGSGCDAAPMRFAAPQGKFDRGRRSSHRRSSWTRAGCSSLARQKCSSLASAGAAPEAGPMQLPRARKRSSLAQLPCSSFGRTQLPRGGRPWATPLRTHRTSVRGTPVRERQFGTYVRLSNSARNPNSARNLGLTNSCQPERMFGAGRTGPAWIWPAN